MSVSKHGFRMPGETILFQVTGDRWYEGVVHCVDFDDEGLRYDVVARVDGLEIRAEVSTLQFHEDSESHETRFYAQRTIIAHIYRDHETEE